MKTGLSEKFDFGQLIGFRVFQSLKRTGRKHEGRPVGEFNDDPFRQVVKAHRSRDRPFGSLSLPTQLCLRKF